MARLDESAAERERIDLGLLCAERYGAWRPLYERHGVWLALAGDCSGEVLALPGAVEQILDNLLSNALRVSPPGSTVSIVPHRLPTPERRFPHRAPYRSPNRPTGRAAHRPPGPSWVELHVMDEGPGMTEEQRRRAFDRFWRAPDAPKGGTGLGLALVQRLAHASGGEALLRQAPRGGLDAVVRLPAVLPGRPGAVPGPPSDTAGGADRPSSRALQPASRGEG